MSKKPHVVWIIANCNTAPYFNWFAEKSATTRDIKFSVICLYHEKPDMIDEMKSFGWECHWLPYDSKKRKSGLLKNSISLVRLLRKLKPDVINSHLFDDSLISMVAGKIARVPNRIVTKGDTGFHYKYTPKWMVFDKLINSFSTKIIAISNESSEFILEKEKANPEKVKMIHHGIPIHIFQQPDDDFIQSFKKEHELEHSFVVGTVSRFIDWKGYKDIIQVAEYLIPKIPSIKFLLIGSGQQKDEIIEIIKQKNLEKYFCLPGFLQPKNMPSVYVAMNAYLHAAKLEPFGFVIAEALAAGLPVVSYPTGAARDVILTGENGWLAEYNHIDQLSNYLMVIYNKQFELPLKVAKETASLNYDFEIMYKNYLKLYLEEIK